MTAVELSAEQAAAAGSVRGPVRVVAGPGAGKTAVIAERFRRLVASGIEPRSILVMTFTERAAREMESRIRMALGDEIAPLSVGTFHGHALGWLRDDADAARLRPGFSVLTGADRWIVLRELLWSRGGATLIDGERPDDLVAPLLRLLEKLRQELIPVDRLSAWADAHSDYPDSALLLDAARLFTEYTKECNQRNQFDFDALIERAVAMLEGSPSLRAKYAARYPVVMVDEYQDTNLAQERLVELIGSGHGNVFTVGDDDQSIYRFRGASRASMERFLRVFPTADQLSLSRNWRSSRPIVAVSTSLIESNPDRIPKRLRSAHPSGPRVRIRRFACGAEEFAAIAAEIEAVRARDDVPLHQMAVLTRTHAIAREVATGLDAAGVRRQLWGGGGFFDRPEIRDVIAYLMVVRDPGDQVALGRLLRADEAGVDLAEVAPLLFAAPDPLLALAGSGARNWAEMLAGVRELSAHLGMNDLFFELMARSGYAQRAGQGGDLDRARAAASLSRFAEVVADYCDREPDQSLAAFLDRLNLVLLSGVDDEEHRPEVVAGAVQVMTIHQAKGLEFDAVFVPALVEGRLPQPVRTAIQMPVEVVESGAGTRGREDHVAEERRLAYVAFTRARRWLHLSLSDRYEGSRPWRPSRFVDEVTVGVPTAVRVEDLRPPGLAAPVDMGEGAGISLSHTITAVGSGPASPPAFPPPASAEERPYSYSRLSAYRECPRRYWYRYVARLAAPDSAEAAAGTATHLALERAGHLIMSGGECDRDGLRRLLGEAWAETGPPENPQSDRLRRQAEDRLERFRAGGGLDGVPHMVEARFTTTVDSWSLRGVIDRVDPPPGTGGIGGQAWRVVDYKTGAPQPASKLRRDFQLALYAIGARSLGLEPVALEIIYLRDGSRHTIAATDRLLRDAAAAGGEAVAGIRAGDFSPRPERRRCRGCAYRLTCLDAV